ncbi:polyprenyl diphosphate synthase [Candidatus Marsarchaeota archaeon]|nr:polyprenyl diphosphate synthase [Candidatus Marsarchaeota archaeon]
MNLFRGYSYGISKFVDFSCWLSKIGVKSLTVWALSTENIQKRSQNELKVLYQLYIRASKDKRMLKMLADNKAHVKFIGDRKLLPAKVNQAFKSIEERTKKYNDFYINILVAYGGREDILHAVRRLVAKGVSPANMNYDEIKQNLRTSALEDPDLIIRTSGEKRLSGLLPWQSSYSELYFSKKYWPDFTKKDLQKAISEYSRRKRRYGK